MKKSQFTIHDDETNTDYLVEELPKQDENPEEIQDDEVLTSDEILALKQLASCADKLLALCTPIGDDDEELQDGDTIEDDDIIEDDDEVNEEYVDTDEEVKDGCGGPVSKKHAHDSYTFRQSYGANRKITAPIDDSLAENKVNEAWKKRYEEAK